MLIAAGVDAIERLSDETNGSPSRLGTIDEDVAKRWPGDAESSCDRRQAAVFDRAS